MSTISFSGLSTGLDTSALISALMKVEQQPIERLRTQQGVYNSQAGKLQSLLGKLQALASAADTLSTARGALPTKASSSDESVVKVSGTAGNAGTTRVEVTSLASSERTYSHALGASDTPGLFGAGTLTLQVGSDAAIDIAVDATDTLDSVAAKINASGAPVRAGLLFDGASYRLRVDGTRVGAEGAITFTESGTSLGLDDPAAEVQAASDALFSVDGFPMSRSSNIVADAIDGVTMTLVGRSSGPVDVTVERDGDVLKESLQSFVDAFNAIQAFIAKETTVVSGVAKGADTLSGDATLRSIQSHLRDVLAVTRGTGAHNTLAGIGVSLQRDGTLALDGSKLGQALSNDPDGVATLLRGSSSVQGVMQAMKGAVDVFAGTADGILTSRISALQGRSRGLDDEMNRLQRRLDLTEQTLTRRFAALEQLVSGLTAQGNQITAALDALQPKSTK